MDQSTCIEPTFKESSKFWYLPVRSHQTFDLETLLMLDQVLIDEPSVADIG